MASLMDELMNTLEQENKEYKKLLVVAKAKTDAIVKADINQLRKFTEKEQKIVERLLPMEKRREESVKDIALVLNRPVEALTITNLIVLMEKQPEVKARLGRIHDMLNDTIKQLTRINNINQGLLKEAIELVNFDITLINNLKQAPLTADYDKSAYNTDVHMLQRGSFDKSQ